VQTEFDPRDNLVPWNIGQLLFKFSFGGGWVKRRNSTSQFE
jgi:hypothetical protein